MMKRQFNRMRQQLSYPGITGRAQETAEFLTEDLLQIEQRIEPAKRAAHNVSKRLQACLQGQCGADMEKRVKKLPLMALSITMAESFKELDTDSSLGRALEMSCFIQSMLAKVLSEFEITLERDVLQPLNKLSEEELPVILKHKKNLQKLISDWNSIKGRLNQAVKNSSNSAGAGPGPGGSSAAIKLENLKEEEEEVKRRVEQCKDEYMADLYHFSTKEDSYANYFIKLMEIQAQYHRKSLESLDTVLAELKETHSQAESPFPMDSPVSGYYGVPLETHLRTLGREIALPIEACVMMLLASGMKEEGLFRLAAGASVLRKLKCSLASGSNALEEFYSDPHAVAGALKSYLRELPQPLMTFELYDDWFKVACFKDPEGRLQSLQDTCSQLPQDNYNNLRYLIKFLAKLAEHQEVNKMTPTNIAIVLGPNLLWSQQSKGDPLQLDLASVSSIQVVGIVEALIQNADTLFPGEIDFNVSGMFTPPPEIKPSKAPSVEEPSPQPLPASARSLTPGEEARRDPETSSGPVSPKATRTSPVAVGPSADDTTRKMKRAAPVRPMVAPPQVQPRIQTPTPQNPPVPESTAIPKVFPRRTVSGSVRAPAIPPPLPPQPARRQSRGAPLSPKLPPDTMRDEASAAGQPPAHSDSTETTVDCTPEVEGPEEPSYTGGPSSSAIPQPTVQSPENDSLASPFQVAGPRACPSGRVRALIGSGAPASGDVIPAGESGMAGCRRLSGASAREVLGPARGLLFDCDGVLWAGERAVPGAPELLERLSRSGKATFFVSNNSRRSVSELEQRFSRLGFRGVRAEQVFSSALCSALLLRQRLLGAGDGACPGPGRVFVLGGEGLRGELREAGLRLAGEGDPAGGKDEPPVRAVLVGYDDQFTFAKLSEACGYLRDPQCLLVATDPDPWHLLSDGQCTPGTGSLMAAVETASGRKAVVVGKPNTYMFDCIVERFGVDPSSTLMVGDRLETDILFGKNCGLATVLTLTGVSRLEEAQAYMASESPAAKDLVPNYYVDSIADLIAGLDE
ncbi:SH3 domain-binding protein 1 [Gopherus flavomarginatus]|uniref:SH3 domain-binding protein 1 n=1 Tax=Gopherus flavomarginatus TaxID=286002 RepID=UPI0021CBE094|nr:SH3 domain-binding protein 1 [Gopherus flavomarginatus]